MSWYQDWQFWAFATALVAVALSQLPPIRLWFKRPKLELEVHRQLAVNHDVGRPLLQIYLMITNTGGRNARINSIILKVERNGLEVATLTAMGYFDTTASKEAVLMVPFELAPDASWGHTVNFHSPMSRDEERRFRSDQAALRAEIQRLIELQRAETADSKNAVSADDTFVRPFIERFNKAFIWSEGEYSIQMTVETSRGRFAATYKFVLYESDRDDLRRRTENYAQGFGVIFLDAPQLLNPLFVQVSK
jgi:hypothetical protein